MAATTIPPGALDDASASELDTLRTALAAKDRAIIDLIRERMTLVDAIATFKTAHNLAPFDREREHSHLTTLVAEGERAGLESSLTRDIFGSLFAASRKLQRARKCQQRDAFSIGIIGGTQGMGAFLARVFSAGGYTVETTGLDHGAPSTVVAGRHDLVLVAVPIASTVETVRQIAPFVRSGACLADVTSLKTAPLGAMLEHTRSDVEVVGTHPMFGLHGEDLDRQKVVLCAGRGATWLARIRQLYELFGAECIESTATEHDQQMALIQVLIHEKTMVLGSVLERRKADLSRSLQFASPVYKTELALIGRMFSQSADLYADILTQNPDATALSAVFEQEAGFFAHAVATGDRAAVVARFAEIAEYMKDFARWARQQSDAILADLVRHG